MAYNQKHRRRIPRRSNRRWSETQNTWAVPTRVAGVIALLAVVGILYAALVHSRSALWEELARAEQTNQSLKDDLHSVDVEWRKMTSERRLIATLRDNGIAMRPTPHARRVAMGGRIPSPGGAGADRGATALAANL